MPLIHQREEITISGLLLGYLKQSCESLRKALKEGSLATLTSRSRTDGAGLLGAAGDPQKALSALCHQVACTNFGPLTGKE